VLYYTIIFIPVLSLYLLILQDSHCALDISGVRIDIVLLDWEASIRQEISDDNNGRCTETKMRFNI